MVKAGNCTLWTMISTHVNTLEEMVVRLQILGHLLLFNDMIYAYYIFLVHRLDMSLSHFISSLI